MKYEVVISTALKLCPNYFCDPYLRFLDTANYSFMFKNKIIKQSKTSNNRKHTPEIMMCRQSSLYIVSVKRNFPRLL